MKKMIIMFMITLMCMPTVYATEIPRESVSLVVTEKQVLITEKLIADILDKVQNGMGYGEAKAQANNILRQVACKNETNGYGFGILSGISNNAILLYRNMYLRPEFYAEKENAVKLIISEIIIKYENGEIDYPEAVKRSYEKIYHSVNPAFDYDEQYSVDICYRNIPPIDDALFTISRKLLLQIN